MAKLKVNKWFILVLLALAQFMVVLDVSIVNVALPSIQKTFSLTPSDLQWVITAYTIFFGGFLLLGGRNADLFGRRRTFLAGVTVFTLASLGSGLAGTGTELMVFRAIQGLSAAYMSPAALSMVLVTFAQPAERNVALAVWGTVASAGAAVGVLAGGLLTQALNWRWNFFVNVPVGIAIIIFALLILDPHRSQADGRRSLDLLGAASVTSGLMLLVYGLTQASILGWRASGTWVFFASSLVLLAAFVVNEATTAHPLLPLSIFRNRNLAAADTLMLVMAATLFSSFFFTTLYLQDILGYTPIRTGVDFIAVPLAIALAATNVPRLVKRVGYKPILIVAPLLVAAGLFWASLIPVSGSFATHVLPGLVLIGFGMGATFVSVTIAATSGVAPNESGLASGLLTTSQQIGGSIGLAALTSIATSSTAHYLASHGGDPSLLPIATVHGFQMAYLIASGLAVGGSLLALFALSSRGAASQAGQTSPAAPAPQTPVPGAG